MKERSRLRECDAHPEGIITMRLASRPIDIYIYIGRPAGAVVTPPLPPAGESASTLAALGRSPSQASRCAARTKRAARATRAARIARATRAARAVRVSESRY